MGSSNSNQITKYSLRGVTGTWLQKATKKRDTTKSLMFIQGWEFCLTGDHIVYLQYPPNLPLTPIESFRIGVIVSSLKIQQDHGWGGGSADKALAP